MRYTILLLLSGLLSACQPDSRSDVSLPLLPVPQEVKLGEQNGQQLSLLGQLRISAKDPSLEPLIEVIQKDKALLFGRVADPSLPSVALQLSLAPRNPAGLSAMTSPESYSLRVTPNGISIAGNSYAAVVYALSTLWQSVDRSGNIGPLNIKDAPDYGYRSLMLDVARSYYAPERIKEAIDLCRFYKLNYLQLHLTDDGAFTFPSTVYPELTTSGHSYTLEELEELNAYAIQRGVVLVPELDVPGHSGAIVSAMPNLFGIDNPDNNRYTISMGREKTYDALRVLIKELAAAFPHSPYIHIGGDEAFFAGMEEDPSTKAFMAKHGLPDVNELFRYFLIRLNQMVCAEGRQTIVWSGFGEHGDLQIPDNVIVMAWQSVYHHPEALLAEGRPFINASFKPLYVVNNRKWSPLEIYDRWHPNRWESWDQDEVEFNGVEIPVNEAVMGATMCVWEQRETNMMVRLQERIPMMAARLWRTEDGLDFAAADSRMQYQKTVLARLLRPFEVSWQGLTYPENEEGNFEDHRWFADTLRVETQVHADDLVMEYSATDQRDVQDWKPLLGSLRIDTSTHLRLRAKNEYGAQVGSEFYQIFHHRPIVVSARGLERDLPPGSWDKLLFENEVRVSMQYPEGYTLRYTIDGTTVTETSDTYQEPITLTGTATVRAQLFDAKNKPFSSGFRETYHKLIVRPSLTTGKPTTSTTDGLAPNGGAIATDGRIALWEHWGDHKSDENWLKVDLGKETTISHLNIVTFWDNYRFYQFKVYGSTDGEHWALIWDESDNETPAKISGYDHEMDEITTRYLRLDMLYNSANPGLHVVEFSAW